MKDQDQTLEVRKGLAGNGVDEHRKEKNCPKKKHTLPWKRHVVVMSQDNEALDQCANQICGRCGDSLPASESDPS